MSAQEFTESDAWRMNRVQRFFARYPLASDLLVCVIVLAQSSSTFRSLAPDLTVHRTIVSQALSLAAVVVLGVPPPVIGRGAQQLTMLLAVNVAVTARTAGCALAIAFGVYPVAATRPIRMAW